MKQYSLRWGGLLAAVALTAGTIPIKAGSVNFTVRPATIQAVTSDGGVTVLLVSGAASTLDESAGRPTSRFTVERIPIIHRHDPKAWHNIAVGRWLMVLAEFKKSGTAVEIKWIAAELLRNSGGAVQAITCLDISVDALKRK